MTGTRLFSGIAPEEFAIQLPSGGSERVPSDQKSREKAAKVKLWTQRFKHLEAPIFAHTAMEISALAQRGDISADQLLKSVLKDLSMTVRVLRMSRSVFYNPTGRPITSLQRAIVLVGFDLIRDIALSAEYVESSLDRVARERVTLEMALALHSAMQARYLAESLNEPAAEDVYVAGLMRRRGHFAFWCFAPRNLAESLDAALRDPEISERDAEEIILGFDLNQLTSSLNREWKISDLLDSCFNPGDQMDPRVRYVSLGGEVALSVTNGWDSPAVSRTIQQISLLLDRPVPDVTKALISTGTEAAKIAATFGSRDARGFLFQVLGARGDLTGGEEPVIPEPAADRSFEPPETNPMVELNTIRRLTDLLMRDRASFDTIVTGIVEGIQNGAGMDRVLFALLTTDRLFLRGRHGVGWSDSAHHRRFDLEIDYLTPNLITHVLENQEAVWVDENSSPAILELLTEDVLKAFRGTGFFIMPVVVNGSAIGVLHADRGRSRRPLDKDGFAGFCHLCRQAGLLLSALLKRRYPSGVRELA